MIGLAHRLGQRLRRLSRSLSVRFKILGIVVGCVLLMSAAGTVGVGSVSWSAMQQEQDQRGLAIARGVAERATDLVLTNDLFGLAQVVSAAQRTNDGVAYVLVLGASDELLADTLPGRPSTALVTANHLIGTEASHVRMLHTDAGLIRDVAVPIFEHRVGEVRVGMSQERLRSLVGRSIANMVAMTGAVALLGLGVAYLVTSLLMQPILRLVAAAGKVGAGDFSVRIREESEDEIGSLGAAFNRMTANLAASREALAATERARLHLLERLITAQEDERRRLARELHDETGQALTCLKVGLRALEEAANLREVRAKAATLRDLATKTMEEVHTIAVTLRPRVLDDLGFVAALQRCVEEFAQRTKIATDHQVVGLERQRLSPAIETTLYRILQESLANVYRHAGASRVSVVVEARKDTVQVIVEDNGRGFEVAEWLSNPGNGHALGLFGMRERAALAGGSLTIESTLGSGTTVFVQVPKTTVGDLEVGDEEDSASHC